MVATLETLTLHLQKGQKILDAYSTVLAEAINTDRAGLVSLEYDHPFALPITNAQDAFACL